MSQEKTLTKIDKQGKTWRRPNEKLPLEIKYTYSKAPALNYMDRGFDLHATNYTAKKADIKRIELELEKKVEKGIMAWLKTGKQKKLFTLTYEENLSPNEGGIVIVSCGNYEKMNNAKAPGFTVRELNSEDNPTHINYSYVCLPEDLARMGLKKEYIQHLITHELGHALGLEHFCREYEEIAYDSPKAIKLRALGEEGCKKTIMEYSYYSCQPFIDCTNNGTNYDLPCKKPYYSYYATKPGEWDKKELINIYKDKGSNFNQVRSAKNSTEHLSHSELGPVGYFPETVVVTDSPSTWGEVENLLLNLFNQLSVKELSIYFLKGTAYSGACTLLEDFLRYKGMCEEKVQTISLLLNALLIVSSGSYGATAASLLVRVIISHCLPFLNEKSSLLGNISAITYDSFNASEFLTNPLKAAVKTTTVVSASFLGSKVGFWGGKKLSTLLGLNPHQNINENILKTTKEDQNDNVKKPVL